MYDTGTVPVARSKEHIPTSLEWHLDIFNFTYFDVITNFVGQKIIEYNAKILNTITLPAF